MFLNHSDFSVFEKNRLKGRAYFVPFSTKAEAIETDKSAPFEGRFHSTRVSILSGGDWLFEYYNSVSELKKKTDNEQMQDAKNTKVPSCWQIEGYEPPHYSNTSYVIPCIPPDIPSEVPVGVYSRKFSVPQGFTSHILTFLGVAPCFDVCINGVFLGYAEGSHNTSEFDITPYLKAGENTLTVYVYKWCSGTYLEAQDMFRNNGIFRDVYIQHQKSVSLFDVRILPSFDKKIGWINLSLSGRLKNAEAEIEVRHNDKILFSKRFDASAHMTSTPADFLSAGGSLAPDCIDLKTAPFDIETWSAETPEVYNVFITLFDKSALNNVSDCECVMLDTGFKRADFSTHTFKLNDMPIKLKGVNHHDTNPLKGYTMDSADYFKDATLMKALNVNAVRCSHYPPDPEFVRICTRLGLYVVDEADIETHGSCAHPYGWDFLANSADWESRFLDRVERMFTRDKNNVSVLMWSLGNESGWGVNHDKCYDYLKRVDPQTAVHYEGAFRTYRRGYDVVSVMYADFKEGERMSSLAFDKPYFWCEYAHAMGMGPGGLEDYWQLIYNSDRLLGGCIWEWADHAMYHPNGEIKYTYGGQHGELIHDGNFCMDGLVYPDRTLHTGARNMRIVYRPLRVSSKGKNKFELFNTQSFTSSDKYTIKWAQFNDGIEVKGGVLPSLGVLPLRKKTFSLDLADSSENTHVSFFYLYNGEAVAEEQVELVASADFCISHVRSLCDNQASPALALKEDSENYYITTAVSDIAFSKRYGTISSVRLAKKEIINQNPSNRAFGVHTDGVKGFYNGIYRAPTDNDRNIHPKWVSELMHIESLSLKKLSLTAEYNKNTLSAYVFDVELWLAPPSRYLHYIVRNTYKIHASGLVDISSTLVPFYFEIEYPSHELPPLPRFGFSIELLRSFKNIQYYGRGEFENYPDFNEHAPVGIYRSEISKLFENYLRPQENGVHTDTRWLKVLDSDGDGLMFASSGKGFFSFNASHTLPELLQCATNPEFIKFIDSSVIRIDGFLRGTGSNSCGPDPAERFIVPSNKILTFSFRLIPIKS